jgi:hypothetical protein
MDNQELNRLQSRSNRSPHVSADTWHVAGFVFPWRVHTMSAGQFLVLNRSNSRVLHQSKTLPEAKGFCEGHPQPTSIAMLAEGRAKHEMEFVIQIVDDDGKLIAESARMYFDDAIDTFMDAKLLLVPACMAKGVRR